MYNLISYFSYKKKLKNKYHYIWYIIKIIELLNHVRFNLNWDWIEKPNLSIIQILKMIIQIHLNFELGQTNYLSYTLTNNKSLNVMIEFVNEMNVRVNQIEFHITRVFLPHVFKNSLLNIINDKIIIF